MKSPIASDRAWWAVGLCLALFVVGCKSASTSPSDDGKRYVTLPDSGADAGDAGGDAGPPPFDASTISGSITLPAGFDGGVTSLKALALLGEVAPDAGGDFAVTGAGNGRQGVMVVDQSDNLILVGWSKPGSPATVSTQSTAAFYLFLYTGAQFMPPSTWSKAVDLLLAAPATTELAVFLGAKLAANPAFLGSTVAADQTAFAQAVGTALNSLAVQGGLISQPLVLVNPSERKSGVTVLIGDKDGNANADVNQITFMNEWRRRLYTFIDRRIGSSGDTYVQEAEFEIPPTTGLNGVVGSITDVINGSGAYTPVYYGPVGLGAVFSEEEILKYRVRVVGNGTSSAVSLTEAQKTQRNFIQMKSILVDLLLPAFFALIDFDWLGQYFNSPFFGEFAKVMMTEAFSGGLIEVGNLLTVGDVWGAVFKLGNILASSGNWRDWVLENFRIYFTIKVLNSEQAWRFASKFSKVLLSALTILEKAMALIEFRNVAADASKASSAEEWEVTVRAPKVIITPAKAKLSCGEKTTFSVVVKNAGQKLETNLTFKFTNTAQYGKLTTTVNSTYLNNFEITKPDGDYTLNTGVLPAGGTDKVAVEVWMTVTSGGKNVKQLIGKAEAIVEVVNECTSTTGYVGSGAYTSGCTGALSVPSVVRPGDEVTVTAKGSSGGLCGSSWVWMSYATAAKLDGVLVNHSVSKTIYDFCYGGGPQPMLPNGVGVSLPDGNTHTLTFTIDPTIKCPICVKEVLNGAACSSNSGNRQNISGPGVVMSGSGGTHGWSTVRFFSIAVPTP